MLAAEFTTGHAFVSGGGDGGGGSAAAAVAAAAHEFKAGQPFVPGGGGGGGVQPFVPGGAGAGAGAGAAEFRSAQPGALQGGSGYGGAAAEFRPGQTFVPGGGRLSYLFFLSRSSLLGICDRHMPRLCSLRFLIKPFRIRLTVHFICFWVQH